MALLHQFADLPLYIRTAGDPMPRNMGELQEALWGFSPG
jgi:hypothetical protein